MERAKDILSGDGTDNSGSSGHHGGAHFIQNAIKHPGALHEELGIPVGQKIPRETLEGASHKPGLLGRRARFALVLEGMRHGKRHPHSSEFEG